MPVKPVLQAGCVPYRVAPRPGGGSPSAEVLLITASDGTWSMPKGAV